MQNHSYADQASKAFDLGYNHLIPVSGKRPIFENWPIYNRRPIERSMFDLWLRRYPDMNWGYAFGGDLVGFDIDFLDEKLADETHALVEQVCGADYLIRIGKYPKRLLVYRSAADVSPEKTARPIEIFTGSGQAVFYGVHPETKEEYQWDSDEGPHSIAPSELNVVSHRQIERIVLELGGWVGDIGSGAVATYIRNLSMWGSVEELAEQVLRSPPGERHNTAAGAVYLAVDSGASEDYVWNTIGDAWFKVKGHKSRALGREFQDMVEWAQQNVD